MNVSILISGFNGKEYLPQLLNSIANLSLEGHDLETLFRDDNSHDGTADMVAIGFPWVKLLRGTKTVGFVKSNNIMFRQASGDIICCVNQDTILDKYFITEGIGIFKDHPEVVGINTNMIMPWILSLENFHKIPVEKVPIYSYRLTPYGYAEYEPVKPVLAETNFLTGGGFFLRRSALKSGEDLFDPKIHMYCEDTELSIRLKKRGCKFMYGPKVVIYHNQAAKKTSSFKELTMAFKITWNRFHVLSKHFSPSKFRRQYGLFLIGIVKKMDTLGLSKPKSLMAFTVGGCLSLVFCCLLPYWVWRSNQENRSRPENRPDRVIY